MMGRHELREQVFRLVFRADFYSAEGMEEQKRLFGEDLPAEDTGHITGEKDRAYIVERCSSILEKLEAIDAVINENTEGWDITRMGKVELAVLRLSVFEILYDDDIPNSVAINEAVELAKRYGQETSGGFVNAILGKIVKTGETNS